MIQCALNPAFSISGPTFLLLFALALEAFFLWSWYGFSSGKWGCGSMIFSCKRISILGSLVGAFLVAVMLFVPPTAK